jgi:hypothetical protein
MPKWEIQEKFKAFVHAAADVSERGNSFHPFGCAINDGENIIKIITIL